jgi:hypothetical protein
MHTHSRTLSTHDGKPSQQVAQPTRQLVVGTAQHNTALLAREQQAQILLLLCPQQRQLANQMTEQLFTTSMPHTTQNF